MGEESGSMTPRIRSDAELPSPTDDPQQIRADMAQTRAEMSETIDAIQGKLSPHHLMQEAKDTVRDATVGKVKDMMTSATDKAADLAEDVQDGALEAVDYVKQNPLPAALIGAGVAWLLMRTSTGRTGPAYSRQRQYSGRGGRPVYGQDRNVATGDPSYRTAGSRNQGPGVTERIQDGWQHYSRRAETQFDRWIRENPLAVGAAALAVGAAVGLSAPATDTENAWLGEARDGLVERVQDVAKDTVTQATQAVESVSQAVDGAGQGNQGQARREM
jgi:ElaB/YqjD/DUF883 family membrane-anchored ribosome-binding protein